MARLTMDERDHVLRGVAGGFAQANHGKATALKRMKAGDGILCYSSKEVYGEETKSQRFTAIGEIADDFVYRGRWAVDLFPFGGM